MTKCTIIWFTVPDGPPYFATGAYRAVAQCETHGWHDLPGVTQDLPGGNLCPIGRIEQATEEALAKIAVAKESTK